MSEFVIPADPDRRFYVGPSDMAAESLELESGALVAVIELRGQEEAKALSRALVAEPDAATRYACELALAGQGLRRLP